MTPSPPFSPKPSSTSSPTSSPTNQAFYDPDTPRPPLAQPSLPPISEISFQPPILPSSLQMGAPGPSHSTSSPAATVPPLTRPRHDKQKSDESIRPSSSESLPQSMEEDSPAAPEQDAGLSLSPSTGEPEPSVHHGKKKRTRTLTTPHQSAVLHALLAQSRFPTTAMREEVGRSIGLSARKVQVWFQNQRQKARKPRTQSAAPLSRPPQFGPFPSGTPPEDTPIAGPSGSSGTFQPGDSPGIQSHESHDVEQALGSAHPRGLPGPGPAMSPYAQPHLPEILGYPPNRSPVQQQYPSPGMGYNIEHTSQTRGGVRAFTPPFGYAPRQGSSPYPSHAPFPPDPYTHRPMQRSSAARGGDPPIVLPPLRFDQPLRSQTHGTLPPPPLHHVEPHFYLDTPRSVPFSTLPSSSSSSSSSSHLPLPFNLSHPSIRHSESLPPPFTLQPQPQWGSSNPIPGPTPALHPSTGLSQGPYGSQEYRRHRTTSDPTRVLPPLSAHLEQERLREPALITQPWPLPNLPPPPNVSSGAAGRRFDPVHSAVYESDRERNRPTEGVGSNGGRRNRHTYDFARPSGSMVTESPPHAEDPHADSRPQGDQTREGNSGAHSYHDT